MTDLTLLVNGEAFSGWTAARVARGIDQLASAFDLELADRWLRSGVPVHDGDACSLLLNGEVVVTGYVDDVEVSYDAASHRLAIRGRDRSGDLVDCAAPAGHIIGQSLLEHAKTVCAPFGISVAVSGSVPGLTKKFESTVPQEGETAYERLDRLAKHRGVLLMADGKGDVVITRAGTQRVPISLVLGDNILSGSASTSQRDRFYKYTVKAQAPESDNLSGADASQAQATALDPHVRKQRETVILADETADSADCATRAKWEASVRAGRALRAVYRVAGWTYDGRTLWPINHRVPVNDPFAGIARDLLIVSITYSLDDAGEQTELTVMPPEAFEIGALPETDLLK